MQKIMPFRRRASALVTTLLVITLLAIILVAFLQSMSIERDTARSYSNITKANLAADSAATEAMVTMQQLFSNYPDSATAWVTNMAPAASTNQTPGTAFFYFNSVSVTNTNLTAVGDLYYRPLVSSGTGVLVADRATALAGVSSLTNWVNLNSTNLMDDKAWLGRLPGAATDPHIDIPWVEVLKDAKVVARYAYWIEDESFRMNLDLATNVVRGAGSMGTNASEVPLQGALRPAIPVSATRDSLASSISRIRTSLPFNGSLHSLQNINYADPAYPNLSDTLGFTTTIYSSALNISRSGARRVNLNALVGTNTSPGDTNTIQKEVNGLMATLANQVPLFGQRFYRTSPTLTNTPGVTATNATIYDYKIVANIRDYLDADSVPTMVGANGLVLSATAPARALGRLNQANPAIAIGKENVPRLQEAVIHVEQGLMSGANVDSHYDVRLTYFFEFWNMGTRDIVVGSSAGSDVDSLPSDAFLGVSNQMEWMKQGGTVKETPADFKIPLSAFVDGNGQPLVFKAGQVTVLASSQHVSSGIVSFNSATVYRPNSTWTAALEAPPFHLTGVVESQPNTSSFQSLGTFVSMGRDGNAFAVPTSGDDNWDAETEVYLGCGTGWLESHPGSVVIRSGIYIDSYSAGQNFKAVTANFHWRGGVLMGNSAAGAVTLGSPVQMGDPRANNEQLSFTAGNAVGLDRTPFSRLRGSSSQSATTPTDYLNFTLGQPNTFTARPDGGTPVWDEGNNARTTAALASGGSPAFYRNGAMQSVGELGHIYDPARGVVPASASVNTAFGGARTLHVGQSETIPGAGSSFAFWDGNPLSPSARWAAWRLLDIFSVTDEPVNKGVINPNGALRDNGAAIQAALEGFVFSSSNQLTDSTLAGKSLSTNAIAQLAGSLTNYLSRPNAIPFFERGQLSELDFFNTNTLPDLAGVTTRTLNDRGREELFRRLAEMIATKGNTYSVYAVGQAMTTLPNGQLRPLATSTRKVTFRLMPQYASTNLVFDPSDSTAVSNRFASPTNYAIQILSAAP